MESFGRLVRIFSSRCGRSQMQRCAKSVIRQPAYVRSLQTSASLYGTGVLKKGENPQKLSREEWLKRLSPEQFYVCREKGTEMPFSGAHANNEDKGTYSCVCCGSPLFSSSTKFESGSGWPSFYDIIEAEPGQKSNVRSRKDSSHGMSRTEVMCRKCNSHLGHVFNDGPASTGLRYCINSESLEFEEDAS